MSYAELQRVLYSYFSENKLFAVLLKYSKYIALGYPIYSILHSFSFFNPITSVIWNFSTILFLAHVIGLGLCFSKREMKIIAVSFLLKSLYNLIFMLQYSVNFDLLLGMATYTLLAWYTFKKSSYNIQEK